MTIQTTDGQLSLIQYENEPDLDQTLRDAVHTYYNTTQKNLHKDGVKNPKHVYEAYRNLLGSKYVEQFHVLILDQASHITGAIMITQGTLTSSQVRTGDILRAVLLHAASSFICVHNHPSGNLEPSPDDINITKKLYAAGKTIEVPLQDHIIVTAEGYTSFKNRGLI